MGRGSGHHLGDVELGVDVEPHPARRVEAGERGTDGRGVAAGGDRDDLAGVGHADERPGDRADVDGDQLVTGGQAADGEDAGRVEPEVVRELLVAELVARQEQGDVDHGCRCGHGPRRVLR